MELKHAVEWLFSHAARAEFQKDGKVRIKVAGHPFIGGTSLEEAIVCYAKYLEAKGEVP